MSNSDSYQKEKTFTDVKVIINMKKTLKEFILSWYYFLKEETWVVKGFIVSIVIIAIAGYHIGGRVISLFIPSPYVYPVVNCYDDVIKNVVCFNEVSKKLYNRFEEEYEKDNTIEALYLYTYNFDFDHIQFDYKRDNNTIIGESIKMEWVKIEWTKKEEKYLNKIQQVFYENGDTFLGPDIIFMWICVSKEGVEYYLENASFDYVWYADDYIPQKRKKSEYSDYQWVNEKVSL